MGTYGIRSALTVQGSDDSPEEVQEVGDMDDVDDVMLVDGSEIGRENHLGCIKPVQILGYTANLNWLATFVPPTVLVYGLEIQQNHHSIMNI